MIILITGATHSGKTVLAQKLLEKYRYPYLSIDHLKMGLIRSGNTALAPESDQEALTAYLWPIVREMIKTAIENRQNLIVEGCYIPFDWKKDFSKDHLSEIEYYCLILSREYIEKHFEDIKTYANEIESRPEDPCSMEQLIAENELNLELCKKHFCNYILVEKEYLSETENVVYK